jgi:hypothetical protein
MKKIKLNEMSHLNGGSCSFDEAVANTPWWAWIAFGASAWLIVGLNREPCSGVLRIPFTLWS